MRNNSLEKKLDRAKESVTLCKLNIKSQEKKLGEWKKKKAIIQNKIANIKSVPSKELEELIIIDSKIMVHVEIHKGIILELEGDLNINENNLQQLKSDSLSKDL